MRQKFLNILFIIMAAFLSSQTLQAAQLGDRHVYILESLHDPEEGSALRITYLFGVQGAEGENSETLRLYPLISKNVDDFRVLEGVAPDSFRTDEKGQVYLQGNFGSELTMIAVGMLFRIKGSQLEIPLNVPPGLKNLELLWNDKNMNLSAEGLGETESVQIGAKPYFKKTWTADMALAEAKPLTLTISGFTEGRYPYWIAAGVFIVLLLLGGFALAYMTKPEINETLELSVGK